MNKLLTLMAMLMMVQMNLHSQSFFRNKIPASDFNGVNVYQAVQALKRKSQTVDKSKLGFNYVFSKKASTSINKTVNLSLGELPMHEVINYVALVANLQVKYIGKTAIFLAKGETYKNPAIRDPLIKSDPRFMVSLKTPCPHVKAEEDSLSDILKDLKEKLQKKGKKVNVIKMASGAPKNTLEFQNVTAYEALQLICIASGISMKIDRSAVVLK